MLRKGKFAIGFIACLLVSRAETFGGEAPRQLPPVSRQAAQTARAPQSQRDRANARDMLRMRFLSGSKTTPLTAGLRRLMP